MYINTNHYITIASHDLPQRKVIAISVSGITDMENWTQKKKQNWPHGICDSAA
jgi:hypothetical protein